MRYVALFSVFIILLSGCADSSSLSELSTREGSPVDISKYSNNVKYKPILDLLNSTLRAIENKNKEEFDKAHLNKEYADGDGFWIDTDEQYEFYGEINIIDHQPTSQRIDVYVQYRELNTKETNGTTVNFGKNDAGEWKVIQLD